MKKYKAKMSFLVCYFTAIFVTGCGDQDFETGSEAVEGLSILREKPTEVPAGIYTAFFSK